MIQMFVPLFPDYLGICAFSHIICVRHGWETIYVKVVLFFQISNFISTFVVYREYRYAFLMAFRLLVLQRKRPNFKSKNTNRHNECPRCMAWVVLMFLQALGRASLQWAWSTFLIVVKRLLSLAWHLLFNLKFKVICKNFSDWCCYAQLPFV